LVHPVYLRRPDSADFVYVEGDRSIFFQQKITTKSTVL